MKAERRHELHTNSLAQFLTDLPLYLRFHANKFLIGLILIMVVTLLVRYRMSTAAAERETIRRSLSSARQGLEQLAMVDRGQPNDVAKMQERRKVGGQIGAAIDEILDNTSDPDDSAIRAEAMIARADMNWTLANLPPLAGASTQPGLVSQQSPSDYLNDAQGTYQKVLSTYDDHKVAKASALFGLAAIEENRGNWDKANEYYKSIIADPKIAAVFKGVAQRRTAMVPELRTPIFLGTYSSTQPATMPTTMETAIMQVSPATQPATTSPGN